MSSDATNEATVSSGAQVVVSDAIREESSDLPKYEDGTDDEQSVMFGASLTNLFDGLRNAIDAALVDCVASLPFLPSSSLPTNDEGHATTGRDKLLWIFRNAYERNFELVEDYCMWNVFKILPTASYKKQTFHRKERQRIIQHFFKELSILQNDQSVSTTTTATSKEGNNTISHSSSRQLLLDETSNRNDVSSTEISSNLDARTIPSKHLIPTLDQIQDLNIESQSLRTKLRSAKHIRATLMAQLTERDLVKAASMRAKATLEASLLLPSNNNNNNSGRDIMEELDTLHSVVSATAILGKDGLDELNARGKNLIGALDHLKELRNTEKSGNKEHEDTMELSEVMKGIAAEEAAAIGIKRKLTLEQEFALRRSELTMDHTTTTVDEEGTATVVHLWKTRKRN